METKAGLLALGLGLLGQEADQRFLGGDELLIPAAHCREGCFESALQVPAVGQLCVSLTHGQTSL